MAGYGMTDPKAAAAINALAAKNNAANKTAAVKPTHTTQAAAAKTNSAINYVNNAAKYMPSVNPSAQKTSTSVWNQSAGNDSAKKAMLAWGANYMPAASPGAQATGSAANQFQAAVNKLGIGTQTGSLWDYFERNSGSSGGGSSSGGSGLSSWLGGGSSGSSGGLGALGSMFGGGGMGGLGGLGSMMGGGGMGGIGDALGGALGGGGGAPQAPAAEEKEPDKPIPQRHWAGGYTSEQQARMTGANSNSEAARLKADFDRTNLDSWKGMQGYDDLKKDRVSQAQQLAERQGGQYDVEGNYYSRDAAKDAISDENKKKEQLAANYYDTPKGAVPIAGNEGDKTPPGSTPAASSGSKDKDKTSGSKSSGLSSDWLKKLGGMAASWFGGG